MRLRQAGYRAEGVEYSPFGRLLAKLQGVEIHHFDCSRSDALPELGRFDVVFSIEVGEHLPGELSGAFVDYIVSKGDLVIFSAAFPGQGGQGHINEQPKEYWAERFGLRGYVADTGMAKRFAELLVEKGFSGWLPHNLQIFRIESAPATTNEQ